MAAQAGRKRSKSPAGEATLRRRATTSGAPRRGKANPDERSIKNPPRLGRARKDTQPDFVEPMLATLTDRPFSREGWIFEPKLDGVRSIAVKHGREVKLWSRNRKLQNDTYPEVVEALRGQSGDFILDGEMAAFAKGISSFELLQGRLGIRDLRKAQGSKVKVDYYVFDILYLNGHDLRRMPLRERKALLKRTIRAASPILLVKHIERDGLKVFRKACARRAEGIIAKRADGPYITGRSLDWLKFKCIARQEFVVGGYTDPQGSRVGLGALLIGYYQDDKLHYAGKVGSGYDTEMLHSLIKRLRPLKVARSPFIDYTGPRGNVHWVQPELVAEVSFTEWTKAGKLRHPLFHGLRTDKPPRKVVREAVG